MLMLTAEGGCRGLADVELGRIARQIRTRSKLVGEPLRGVNAPKARGHVARIQLAPKGFDPCRPPAPLRDRATMNRHKAGDLGLRKAFERQLQRLLSLRRPRTLDRHLDRLADTHVGHPPALESIEEPES
jgi:hypothetical protein